MTTYNVVFGEVREKALTLWLKKTRRTLIDIDIFKIDDFSDSFECKWQMKAQRAKKVKDKTKEWHVPHFCSLGDWASNITDLLTDERYDMLHFAIDDPSQDILFRYYTRFMLVISELINDFVELLEETKICPNSKSSHNQLEINRNTLSCTNLETQALMDYINSVCKHKVKPQLKYPSTKLHTSNNHLSIFFKDSGKRNSGLKQPLEVGNINVNNPDGIIVPKISSLITIVLNGYKALDEGFKNDPQKFKDFIERGMEIPI